MIGVQFRKDLSKITYLGAEIRAVEYQRVTDAQLLNRAVHFHNRKAQLSRKQKSYKKKCHSHFLEFFPLFHVVNFVLGVCVSKNWNLPGKTHSLPGK